MQNHLTFQLATGFVAWSTTWLAVTIIAKRVCKYSTVRHTPTREPAAWRQAVKQRDLEFWKGPASCFDEQGKHLEVVFWANEQSPLTTQRKLL